MEATASKKRKLNIPGHGHGHVDVVDDDDEDINEEEKIEKFFALIKNIREARERLITNGLGTHHAIMRPDIDVKDKKRKLEEEIKKQAYAWKPSFQREDFMEEADHHKSRSNPASAAAVPLGESSSHGKEVRETTDEIKESLDLRLSL